MNARSAERSRVPVRPEYSKDVAVCLCSLAGAPRDLLPAPQPSRSSQKAPDQNSTTLNSALLTSHNGHRQSSGISENRVPGAIPSSGSPAASSYTHPQIRHTQLLYSITSLTVFQVLSHLEVQTTASADRVSAAIVPKGGSSAVRRSAQARPRYN